MGKYLLLWGEAPEYCYENPFDTAKEALDWVNSFGVKWNSIDSGHWFKFYEERMLISDNMWEDMKAELKRRSTQGQTVMDAQQAFEMIENPVEANEELIELLRLE